MLYIQKVRNSATDQVLLSRPLLESAVSAEGEGAAGPDIPLDESFVVTMRSAKDKVNASPLLIYNDIMLPIFCVSSFFFIKCIHE